MSALQIRTIPPNTLIYEKIDEDGNVTKILETTSNENWCPPFDKESVEVFSTEGRNFRKKTKEFSV